MHLARVRIILIFVASATVFAFGPRVLADKPPGKAALLVLEMAESPREPGVNLGLLVREIVRQALWIAAEERGIPIRDAVLREPPSSKQISPTRLRLEIKAFQSKVSIRVAAVTDGGSSEVWKNEIPLSGTGPLYYTEITTKMEELSRHGFVDALRAAGFAEEARAKSGNAKLSQNVDTGLGEMGLIDQFSCLRQIHGAAHLEGISPDLLGGLVRGYANLGELTRFFWNAMPQVFMARALLYAERLVQAQPKSVVAHWHRAYARAVVGLHAAAFDELGEINRLTGSNDKQEAGQVGTETIVPKWTKLIEPLCLYKTTDLVAIAKKDKSLEQTAYLLALLTLEHTECDTLALKTAGLLLDVCGDCYRAHDMMCDMGGVSTLHRATLLGPQVLGLSLADQLEALPKVPKKAVATARIKAESARGKRSTEKASDDEGSPVEALGITDACSAVPLAIKALVDATSASSDTAQPTWATLGRMLEEVLYIQVYRRADFMHRMWGVPVDQFIESAMPLVENHPYAALVASFKLQAPHDAAELREIFEHIQMTDFCYKMVLPFRRPLLELGDKCEPLKRRLSWEATFHGDGTAFDQCEQVIGYKDKEKAARELMKYSPQSPIAYATLVERDWETAKRSIQAWERRYGFHPAMAAALSRQYSSTGHWAEAERWLKSYLKMSPDSWGYVLLAENYLKQGSPEKWKGALDEYLGQGDEDLEHSRVRIKIADYFVSQKKWKEALPYAEAAGQSWAFDAMDCAARCREGSGDWKEAELWRKRIAERYESERFGWYFWCVRTGHGDLAGARHGALAAVESLLSSDPSPDDKALAASVLLLERKIQRAMKLLRQAYEVEHVPYTGWKVVVLAQEQKDFALRDDILRKICETHPAANETGSQALVSLAQLMLDAISRGDMRSVDAKSIERLSKDAPAVYRANMYYFAGRLIEGLNEPAKGKEFLWRAATWDKGSPGFCQLLAIDTLKRRGENVPVAVPGPKE